MTEHYGWPWIFYINVPVSLIGIVLALAFIHNPPYLRRGVPRIDWVGIGLLTLGITMLQFVLERGQENNWFESSWIIAGSLITLLALGALVWWELRTEHPIVDFRILRNRPLALGSCMGVVFGIGLFGSTFFIPQFTENLLGYSAYDAGVVLLPRAVTLFLCMPVAGWLYRYFDARALILFGLAIMMWAFYDLSHLSLQMDKWTLIPMLLIMGAGMPFMFVTMSTVSLGSIPRYRMTEATSIYTLARRVGGNIGYAIVATVFARQAQTHRVFLRSHLSPTNPNFAAFQEKVSQGLRSTGRTLKPRPIPPSPSPNI